MAETNKKPAEEKLVTIMIPRESDSRKNKDVYVSVNDETWLIPRGVSCEVPERVAYVLEKSNRLNNQALDYAESKKNLK